jgi:hypothetical protein
VVLRDIDTGDKSVDALGSISKGTVSEVLVKNFTTAHSNVLVRLKGISNGNFSTTGRDEIHLANLKAEKKKGIVRKAPIMVMASR